MKYDQTCHCSFSAVCPLEKMHWVSEIWNIPMLHLNNHCKVEQCLFQILICVTTFSVIFIYIFTQCIAASLLPFSALILKVLFCPLFSTMKIFFPKYFIQLPAYLHCDTTASIICSFCSWAQNISKEKEGSSLCELFPPLLCHEFSVWYQAKAFRMSCTCSLNACWSNHPPNLEEFFSAIPLALV